MDFLNYVSSILSEEPMIPFILGGIGVLLATSAILWYTLEIKAMRKRSSHYTDYMTKAFEKRKNIKDAMIEVADQYTENKRNSAEEKALKAGLWYLEHSIRRDYKSAFLPIENLFLDEDVKELHCGIINKQKEILLLELKEVVN